MTDPAIPRALLVLRIALGVFLLQWGIEKFVVPANTPGIWSHFYGIPLPEIVAYLFGTVEIVLAGCFFLGLARTWAFGTATLIHAVSVIVTWRPLLSPWSDPVNHLFIAGVPVLAAFAALFMLRHLDRGWFDPSADAER